MAPISSVRVATCVVAAALVGAAAATLPAEARAEDGPASAPETATTMSTLDSAALAGEASAAVESAVTDAVGAAAQALEPQSAVEATVPAPPSDAGTGSKVPSTAPATPETTASMPDTTAHSADTTLDIGPTPAAPAPAPQATSGAVQSAPSNVNVTVRIGSAGDNGPVTQVNVAAAASAVATAATSPSSPAARASSSSTSSAQPSPAVSAPATTSSSTSQDDPGTWTWQWNCLSAPDLTAISPSGSTAGSVPNNWTWIWNCGSNPDQYQEATSSQYQPSNVNVSIRISSPGNDGPVTQANVAAALGVLAGTSTVAAAVHAAIPPALTQPPTGVVPATVSGIPAVPGLPSLPELVAPAGAALVIGDVTGVTIAPSQVSIFDLVELPFAIPPFPSAAASDPGSLGQTLPRLAAPGLASGLAPWSAPVTLRSGAPDESAGGLAEAVQSRGSDAGEAAGLRGHEKPAPRWKAPAPAVPVVASVSSGTSVAPASGGGSSGSGIPVFLALPFLAAMLDLARRVALDRVALPSGHRSRMPENPG